MSDTNVAKTDAKSTEAERTETGVMLPPVDVIEDAMGITLYADLPEKHLLTVLPDFTPERLIDRYNLAQAQGLLYPALDKYGQDRLVPVLAFGRSLIDGIGVPGAAEETPEE